MTKRLILSGRVQGVFCRHFCSQYAKKLGINGSATNLSDGTVRVLLDTDDNELLNRFIDCLKTNPDRVRFQGNISGVDVSEYDGVIGGDYVF